MSNTMNENLPVNQESDALTTPTDPGAAPVYRRHTNGKFQRGTSGGPGRTPKNIPAAIARNKRFRAALQRVVTNEDFDELAQNIVEDAKHGSREAQTLLFGLLRD